MSSWAAPLSALLLALAVLTLRRGSISPRLRALQPPPVTAPDRLSPAVTRAACVLAALGLWGLVGGPVGPVLAALVVVAGPRALSRLRDGDDVEAQVARDLPLALDLLAACLAGGAVPLDAVLAVGDAVPGACGSRLVAVGARLAVGSDPAEAWRALGDDRGPAGAAARALSRAAVGGASVAESVQRVARDARREAAARAERAARRAGVLSVGPLGLCFLPAFLLLGVVPAVLGLAAPLLHSLS